MTMEGWASVLTVLSFPSAGGDATLRGHSRYAFTRLISTH
jgi:hypothetical protein